MFMIFYSTVHCYHFDAARRT